MDYAKSRKAHLARYAVEHDLKCCGLWREKPYCHILFVEDDKQNEAIKKNLLKRVKADMLKKPHADAHHLNSSQILCYNFFRPLITNEGKATAELVSLLGKYGVAITKNATCQFEYTDKIIEDGTQFDFYIKDGEIEVFFEIKYTENCFKRASSSDSAKRQYMNWYEEQFKQQQCLKEIPANIDDFISNYTQYYQLYRNAIRITDKNKHLILLYPKNNTAVNKEATTFLENKIREEYRGNIHILHWEDIVKEGELYEKYFAE